MNKQQALEILQKHNDFMQDLDAKPRIDVSKETNPNSVWVGFKQGTEKQKAYEEFCKENGTIKFKFDVQGGEGEGTYYHSIHKIVHPTLGEGYLQYIGDYDSWNGVDWHYNNNPHFVIPVKKMVEITEWHDV